MALRQAVCGFEASWASAGQTNPIPKVRAPVAVGFRHAADLSAVCGQVQEGGLFLLDAARGAGKTTVFPFELARLSGAPVLVLMPYSHMAAVQVARAREMGKSVALVTEVDHPYPSEGVAYVSAAAVVAKWLQQGRVSFPKAHVVHDESHECDAFTAVVRWLAPAAGALSYVRASATHDCDVRVSEGGAGVDQQSYRASAFADPWDLFESGAPWSADDLREGLVVFEDDKERAAALLQGYNMAGARAHRLHARSRDDVVVSTLRAASTDRRNVYVLIVDSSFRSSYTFAGDGIDSGLVRYVAVKDGRPINCSRSLYLPEVHQSAGRFGRVPGRRAVYHLPEATYDRKVCDLLPSDVDAAAVILRVLGYAVPRELRASVFASGELPSDLPGALRSPMPLAALQASQLRQVVGGGPAGFSGTVRIPSPTPALRVGAPAALQGAVPGPAVAAGLSADIAGECEGAFNDLAELLAGPDVEVELVEGRFYHALGLVTTEWTSSVFPCGAESVMVAMRESSAAQVYWSPYEHAVAVNACVVEWNLRCVEMTALVQAIAQARRGAGQRERNSVVAWARRCSERLSVLTNSAAALREVLLQLTRGKCALSEVEGEFNEQVEELKLALLEGFYSIPTLAGPAVEQLEAVRGKSSARALVLGYTDTAAEAPGYHRVAQRVGKLSRPSVVSPLLLWAGGGSGYGTISTSSGRGSASSQLASLSGSSRGAGRNDLVYTRKTRR